MLAITVLALSEPNGLGRTPPMGYNPYNHMKASGYTFNPNETTIRATAAALLITATQAAWGPREALKRHEAEHDAAHAKEAAVDVEHLA